MKLTRTVELRLFQDDATGDWGLCHKETMDGEFNAFWTGDGIFHDVFEHAHEFVDPYFSGDAAQNIGGEVAAMGALWYLYNRCGVHNRLNTSYRSPDDIVINSTFADMQESIEYGNTRFGDRLVCAVPRQKPVDDSSLEWIADEHFERIKKLRAASRADREEREVCAPYKKSVTKSRLANLYRYGYKQAERIASGTDHNTLVEFIDFWNSFCKKIDAEELYNFFQGITFELYKDDEDNLFWKATFNPKAGDSLQEYVLYGGIDGCPKYVPSMEDFYALSVEDEN